MTRALAVLLATLAACLAVPGQAQTPAPTADLEDQIRSRSEPEQVFTLRALEAYDEAVREGAYARADSVAALIRSRRAAAGREPRAWPSRADALALAVLLGDRSVLGALVEEGRGARSLAERLDGAGTVLTVLGVPGGLAHGPAVAGLLPSLRAALEAEPAEFGTDEERAVLRLAVASWLATPVRPGRPLTREREAINDAATAFLERYPRSRYADYVRYRARVLYRRDVAQTLWLGAGGSGLGGALAERADGAPFAVEVGYDLRGDAWHLGVVLVGGFADIREGFDVGPDRAEAGERYQLGLIGLESGPLLRLGVLEAMPYGAVGLALRSPTNEDGAPPQGSTFDPPDRLGLGYGLKVAVRAQRPFAFAPGLHARLGWIAGGLGDRDGVDLTGPVRVATLALSYSINGGRRHY